MKSFYGRLEILRHDFTADITQARFLGRDRTRPAACERVEDQIPRLELQPIETPSEQGDRFLGRVLGFPAFGLPVEPVPDVVEQVAPATAFHPGEFSVGQERSQLVGPFFVPDEDGSGRNVAGEVLIAAFETATPEGQISPQKTLQPGAPARLAARAAMS